MSSPTIAVIGLPGSGKTTFLAALWHVVNGSDGHTFGLRVGSLKAGAPEYLNRIVRRWRNATEQGRTQMSDNALVRMNLLDDANRPIDLAFPDVAGEAYQQMWEERDCGDDVERLLQSKSVLMFVNSNSIRRPLGINELNRQVAGMNMELTSSSPPDPVAWSPEMAPTQVKLVDLLQLLRRPPLDIGPRKLAIGLSAWDAAEAERMNPREFLTAKLPLLAQYLMADADSWDWTVFGISAQGGQYRSNPDSAVAYEADESVLEAERASDRIRVVSADGTPAQDITSPLIWLMEK